MFPCHNNAKCWRPFLSTPYSSVLSCIFMSSYSEKKQDAERGRRFSTRNLLVFFKAVIYDLRTVQREVQPLFRFLLHQDIFVFSKLIKLSR